MTVQTMRKYYGAAPAPVQGNMIVPYCEPFSVDWWLIFTALLALMFIARLGDLCVLIYLVCAAAIIQRNFYAAYSTLVRYFPLLSLPALMIFSTIWSDAPDASLKQGLEFLLFAATALVICRRIDVRGLAAALFLTSFIACLTILLVQPSALKGATLLGFMASKNQVAFVAQILLVSSIAVIFDAKLPMSVRAIAVGGVAMAALEIKLAQSGGGLVSAAVSVAAFAALGFLARAPTPLRILLVSALLLICLSTAIASDEIVRLVQTLQEQELHKDATLTGRTDLWRFAQALIAQRPVFGHGYTAFWQQGNPDAEALWRTFGIANRSGFNFHNQFVDTLVDFGWVGVCLLAANLVAVGGRLIWRAIRHPSLGTTYMVSMLVALYVRLPVESSLMAPWIIFTLIFWAGGVHAFGPPGQSIDAAMPPSRHPNGRSSGSFQLCSAPTSILNILDSTRSSQHLRPLCSRV